MKTEKGVWFWPLCVNERWCTFLLWGDEPRNPQDGFFFLPSHGPRKSKRNEAVDSGDASRKVYIANS